MGITFVLLIKNETFVIEAFLLNVKVLTDIPNCTLIVLKR